MYLHSDVYLPEMWFDNMEKYKNTYDWFECKRKLTHLVETWGVEPKHQIRALSGSQFGRTDILKNVSKKIRDDYSYRQEDIIFAELLKEEGGKYHIDEDTFHYHQIMNKVGAEVPMYKSISAEREYDRGTEIMIWNTQVRGLIKYLKPKKYLIREANISLYNLNKLGALNWKEFNKWVKVTNPVWLKHINRKGSWQERLKYIANRGYIIMQRIRLRSN